jgi:hypothetical protein
MQAMLDNGNIRSSIVGGVPREGAGVGVGVGVHGDPTAKPLSTAAQHRSLPVGASATMFDVRGDVARPHSTPASMAQQGMGASRPSSAVPGPGRPTSGKHKVIANFLCRQVYVHSWGQQISSILNRFPAVSF